MMTFKLINSSFGESLFEEKHAEMSWGGGQDAGLPGKSSREGPPEPPQIDAQDTPT